MRYILIILAILSLVAGCSEGQSHNGRLSYVEQLMNEHADSAYCVLEDQAGLQLGNAADSALYGLLYTEVLHVYGQYLYSDSLVTHSIKYYSANGDRSRLARAYLGRGRNRYLNGLYPGAISDLLKARHIAEHSDDSLNYEISYLLGRANFDIGCLHFAETYFRECLESVACAKNVDNKVRSMVGLANTFEATGQVDSFMTYMKRCQPLTVKVSDAVRDEMETNNGSLYMHTGNYPLARKFLEKAALKDISRRASKLLGDLYSAEGRTDDAVVLWCDAASSSIPSVSIAAIDSLIEAGNQGTRNVNMQTLLEIQRNAYRSLPHAMDAENAAVLQNQYYESLRSQRTYVQIIMLLSAVIILLVGIMAFYAYHKRRMTLFKSKIRTLNSRYLSDLEAYNTVRNEMERLKEKLAEYQEDRTKPDEWGVSNELLNADIVFDFHRMAAKGCVAKVADWASLRRLVAEADSGFMAQMTRHENISDKELNICILVRLRFIPSEIAALTASSPQAVTNIRMRLLSRIFNKKGGAKDFDALIRLL